MNEGLSTHFLELRNRILYSFSFFVIAFVCIYPFNNYFFNNIVDYLQTFTTIDLIAVEVASPFIVPLKLSAFIAALISIPFLLYQTLAFMSPGLYPKERSVIFSRTTIGSCFLVVLPNVLNFFQTVGPESIKVSTDISNFLSFVLTLSFGFGIAFQIPLIVNALIKLKITNKIKLKSYRGLVLILCFIFGMIFTPPDIISQFLMAVPMYLLFEIGLLFSNDKKT